jgi:PAS domain S-box-containing protein
MAIDQHHFASGTAMAQDSPQDSNEFQRALFEALAKLQKGEAAQPSLELTFDHLQNILEQQQSLKDDVSQQLELFKHLSDLLPGFIWTASADGQIDYINKRWYDWSGSSEAESLGDGWLTLVHPEEKEQVVSTWQSCVTEYRDFEIEMRMKRFDGEYRWFLVRSLPIKDESGATLSWCGSCTDIDTHRRLVTQLKMARDQAQSALKIKSEFVANVSHELRTPLNGILGMVEILLRGDLSPKSKEHVSTIREAGASLLSIINEILDFSKIEAGKMELSSTQFNPLSVVEGVAEILVPQAAAKNLLLLATVDRAIPDTAFGDPLRLRQVLLNLCGNAIKFTDQGQIILKVEVASASNGRNQLRFSVIDSGIGISKAFQKRLFEPFMQEEGSSYRSTGGTGLGLSISKHLVDLMDGTLIVHSEENQGSTFSFALPLITSDDDSDWTARAWESSYGQIKILTLEPGQNNQSAICSHLCALGVNAQSTSEYSQAIELLEKSRQSTEKIQAICLDTIRYKKQCEQFLEAFKRSKVFGLVSVIEIGTTESLSQARSTLVAPRTSHLLIPLRRRQVASCLEHLSGWKPKERESDTQTMEVPSVKAETKNEISCGSTEQLTQAKAQSGIIRRALVADDNKINQQVALLFLQDLGFIVDVTADGIEAVSAFNKKRYDMVFLDCQMPGLDGFEACKIIKEIQQRRGLNVPVIAVTANAVTGSREECLDRGMDDYLSKPIDPTAMSKLVARWLGVSDVKITIMPSQESTSTSTTNEPQKELSGCSVSRGSVIDLKKLRNQLDGREIEKTLLHFRTRCHKDMSEINSLAEQSNLNLLKAKVHSFKRACATISAQSLVDDCEAIEAACDKQANQAIKKNLVDLRQHLKCTLSEIERELLQQKTTTS